MVFKILGDDKRSTFVGVVVPSGNGNGVTLSTAPGMGKCCKFVSWSVFSMMGLVGTLSLPSNFNGLIPFPSRWGFGGSKGGGGGGNGDSAWGSFNFAKLHAVAKIAMLAGSD